MFQRLRKPRFFHLPILLILTAGFLASIWLFLFARQMEQRSLENEFKLFAAERVDILDDMIQENLSVLMAIRSFYGASQFVARDEFGDFVNLFLDRYPSILALIWAPKVPQGQRHHFVKKAREDGFIDFEIFQENAERTFVPAGKKETYFPVFYVEPDTLFSEQIGLDLNMEKTAPVLAEARDSGVMAATERLSLPGYFQQQSGFLVFMPVYAGGPVSESIVWRRQNLEGMVVGVYQLEDIIARSLTFLKPHGVNISIDDTHTAPENRILYREGGEDPDLLKTFVHEQALNVGGRKWKVTCTPAPGFFDTRRTATPFFVLFAGLLVTAFISRYVYSHKYRTQMIENLVAQRTSELISAKEGLEKEVREHEATERQLLEISEQWRSLAENAPDIIMTIDLEGRIQFINRTAAGLTVQGVLGRKVFEFVESEHHSMMKEKFETVIRTGEPQSFDAPTMIPGQAPRWYRSRVGPIQLDGKITSLIIITSDVTEQKQVEDHLRHTREFLDRIIDSVADPIFVKDRKHHFVLVNDVLCSMMGHKKEELIGKSDYDFFPKAQVEVFLEKDELVFKTGRTNINEEEFTDKDGLTRTISTKKSLYVDPWGREFIVGVIRDISDERQAQKVLMESRKLYEDLFEYAPDPIIRLTPLGHFDAVNPAAEKTFGKSKEELLGIHFSKAGIFSPASKMKMLNEFHLTMLGDRRPPSEVEILTQDGETRIYEGNPRVIERKGRPEAMQIIFRDITERKRREEVEVKSRFVSTVSHELRTPLQSIREGMSLILDRSAGDINAQQEEFLQIVKRNVERLARLIDNVLDFQKVDALKESLHLDDCSLNEITDEVVKMMNTLIQNEGLALQMDLDPALPRTRMDHDKIMQVVINLLDNAIKFTKKGSIRIGTKSEGGKIKFSVSDTGLGIKKEHLSKLFQAFSQIKTPAKNTGTGLGLAISRQIIEKHGGRIGAESTPGQGSTFWFELPAAGV